jgi:hypothetical protein
VYNSNGTITTYWCVIYVVHGGCDPPIYCWYGKYLLIW